MTTGHLALQPGRAELERLLVEDNAALGRGVSALARRRHGLGLLLDWLEGAEGSSWQARWVQLGEPADWQAAAGATSTWQRLGMTAALTSLLGHRILQPSYPWLFRQRLQTLGVLLFAATDQGEDTRLVAAGRRVGMSATMLGQALSVLAYALVHTGRRLDQLTTADVLAYGQARRALGKPALGVVAAQQLLHELGIVDQPAATKGARWRVGQRTMAELVDRYPIACRPVRDLLVRYLEERAPAMDYASLPALARRLVGLFWCDLERHHPSIGSLHLPAEAAAGWRRRALLRADGRPRRDAANLFTSVRAFTSTSPSGPPRTRLPGPAGSRPARSPRPTCAASPRPSTTSRPGCTPASAPWPRPCPPWSPPPTSICSPLVSCRRPRAPASPASSSWSVVAATGAWPPSTATRVACTPRSWSSRSTSQHSGRSTATLRRPTRSGPGRSSRCCG